jgi:branched-chain amino acid aminotransferase
MALFDLYGAEEAFLTGTAAEVVPVTKLDNRPIGNGKPGEVTQKLIKLFKELSQNEGDPVF